MIEKMLEKLMYSARWILVVFAIPGRCAVGARCGFRQRS